MCFSPASLMKHRLLCFIAALSRAMSLKPPPRKRGTNQKTCAFQKRFYPVQFLFPFHIKEEGIWNLVGFQLFLGSSQSILQAFVGPPEVTLFCSRAWQLRCGASSSCRWPYFSPVSLFARPLGRCWLACLSWSSPLRNKQQCIYLKLPAIVDSECILL